MNNLTKYVTSYETVTVKDGSLDCRWVVWRIGFEIERHAVSIAGTMDEAEAIAERRNAQLHAEAC